MKKYKIIWSPIFSKELNYIFHYLCFILKEPMVAKKIYRKVLKQLATLEYLPEIYPLFCFNNKVYRKLFVNKYIIIYQVDNNTRTSLYFTYFSWKSKLSK